jgi:hypothetical protein|tara:strand:+ start:125 stop:625 length:501 start_codon:yes stop_codon:yes gene_type:complete
MPAFFFTEGQADPTQDRRKGNLLTVYGQGLGIFTFFYETDVSGTVYSGRTGGPAGNELFLALDRPDIPISYGTDRTDLGAHPAEDTSGFFKVGAFGANYRLAILKDKTKSIGAAHVTADPDAPGTSDAQIIVTVKEGSLAVDGLFRIIIGQRPFLNVDINVISYLL